MSPADPPAGTGVRTGDGVRLHVEISGPAGAGTTVVLAHGWALSSRCWDPVLAAFELARVAEGTPGLRVIRYDQRHHGRSGRGGAPLDIELLGTDLAAVLDALVPAGPVVLAGHSMGGMTVLALAAARPELFGDRITGVALVSTRAVGGRAGRLDPFRLAATLPPSVMDGFRRLLPPANPLHRRLIRDLLFGPGAAAETVRFGAEIIQATPIRTLQEFGQPLARHDKTAALPVLRRVPVSILVGALDRLAPVRYAESMAGHIPGAELTVLPRYGHMLPLEHPELVARTIVRLALARPAPAAAEPAERNRPCPRPSD